MQLYIHRNGQQTGPYTVDEIRSYLENGSFQPTDLAWYEGASGWLPLSSISGLVAAKPPFLPPRVAYTITLAQTSGLAISSLVLGILSILVGGLTSIPAVICGHKSLSRIKKSAGAISGQGIAIAGLITGYIGLALFAVFTLAIVAGIALPVFNAATDRAKAYKSLSQAKQIASACRLYALDHGDKFPETLDELVPKYLPDKKVFICPMMKDQASIGYEYFGGKYTDPAEQVLLMSKASTKNHMRVIVYVDGTG